MTAPAAPSLSIIIVTYHHEDSLRETLESVYAQDLADREVLVLDNASTDATLAVAREFLPCGLKLIVNPVNRGFGAGNNQAVAASRGTWLLLLNPDMVIDDPTTLRRMLELARTLPEGTIVGPKLLAPDRRTIMQCGGRVDVLAHTELIGRGEIDDGQHDRPAEVEFIEGGAMLLTRALWDRLGGFDEDFFPAYYEDTWFCVRCRRRGGRILLRPEFTFIHRSHEAGDYQEPNFWRMFQASRVLFNLKRHPLPVLLFRWLPAELRWLGRPEMKYLRPGVLRAYKRVIKVYLKKWLGRPITPPLPSPPVIEQQARP